MRNFFTFLAIVFATNAIAQKPKAILVEITSGQQKRKYFEHQGNTKAVQEINVDVQKANRALISDFNDHFNFCPVYYFVDSNIDDIKNKSLAGILLDSGLKKLDISPLNNSDSTYLVAYFGYPQVEYVPDERLGLIVLNDKWKELFHHMQHAVDEPKVYHYTSSKYNIKYQPVAYWLNKELNKLYPK